MKTKKLVMCAWGPYRNKQEIDFTAYAQEGIFLITGATGAGKTSIFDAITYALYGALSGEERDKERSSVRSDFAEPNTPTYVELEMEHGGQEYRIVRNPEYLRPRKRGGAKGLTTEKENAVLYCPDGKIIEGCREVNAALKELLVLDYQQFKKVSMIAQGEFARLLVAPPKEKTRIFREIFGTGIYEQFTAELGKRSRLLYARVMEQRHKLEEDIRLLTTGMEDSLWEIEQRQQLSELVDVSAMNLKELEECLRHMEEKAVCMVKMHQEAYQAADVELEKVTVLLSGEEEKAAQRQRYIQSAEEKERLEALEEEYRKKEHIYGRAVNAGFVEASAHARAQLKEQQKRVQEEMDELNGLMVTQQQEMKKLEKTVCHAVHIRELLELKKQLVSMENEYAQLKESAGILEKELKEGQGDYLVREKECSELKKKYEEEDYRRRLAAIGLAAELLEEGKPCPVCGSIVHPAPAKAEEGLISEKELIQLKKQWEKQEKALGILHEELIRIRTRLETQKKQGEELVKNCTRLKEQLDREESKLCRSFLELPVEQAVERLNRTCERVSALTELFQERERQLLKLEGQEGELKQGLNKAEAEFETMLCRHHFADEKDFEEAKMDKELRERLKEETESYRNRRAANEELYLHLREQVQKMGEVQVAAAQERISVLKQERECGLKLWEQWRQLLTEVKKIRRMIKSKQKCIEEDSKEYGYVKDLENMANGNNAGRLVFEQYVLAGYFEEILKAANLRFQRMSMGRYEMFRVGEVGDGRVKDNLEIQVLDYYTGKYRSVRTLSGGEVFKASLSLALGMSDVIQAMNGGIRVDMLFVDEGFGALDAESLEQACSTLMSLAKSDCMIGIISHVPELRERIGQQLVVHKTNSGSEIVRAFSRKSD